VTETCSGGGPKNQKGMGIRDNREIKKTIRALLRFGGGGDPERDTGVKVRKPSYWGCLQGGGKYKEKKKSEGRGRVKGGRCGVLVGLLSRVRVIDQH